MEPMEVIDLSSDDENLPTNIADAGSSIVITKREQNTPYKNAGSRVLSNANQNKKRRAYGKDEDPQRKKSKLSNNDSTSSGSGIREVANQSTTTKHTPQSKSKICEHGKKRVKLESVSPRTPSKPVKLQPVNECYNKTLSKNNTDTSVKLLSNGLHVKDGQKASNNRTSSHSFKINEGASSSKQIVKPQLVIGKRIKVPDTKETMTNASLEVFKSFLDACISQDSSGDMEKIISRLKKRYHNLEPCYAKSGNFMQLIHQKKNLIATDATKCYMHISEVMDEMKARQVQNTSETKIVDEIEEKKSDNSRGIEEPEENYTLDEETANDQDIKDSKKLRALEKAMRRCERYIKKCEMAEVDFNDNQHSHYILAEKYKYRMVELYNKYCEITGEKPDAARPYLRPKHLSFTPLPALNHAITSFVNMKITKMTHSLGSKNKKSRRLPLTDSLIFPDYEDILNCIKKCNELQNLKLTKVKQESIAKKAFLDLGSHLQRCRRSDYYDTFSLYLDREDCDPALEDKNLAAKLRDNQKIGKQKLNEVFEQFVEKQNAVNLDEISDPETSDKESSEEDESNLSQNENETSNMIEDCSNSDAEDSVETKTTETEAQKIHNQEDNDHVETDKQTDDNKEMSTEVESVPKLSCNSQKSLSPAKTDKTDKIIDIVDASADTIIGNASNTTITVNNEPKQDKISNQKASVEELDEIIEVPVEDEAKMPLQTSVDQTEGKQLAITEITIVEPTTETPDRTNTEKFTPPTTPDQKTESVTQQVPIQNVVQTPQSPQTKSPDVCLPEIPTNNTEVNDAVASPLNVSPKEEEKRPMLRLRPFAKTPGFWSDVHSPTESPKTADADLEVQTINKVQTVNKVQTIRKTAPGKYAPSDYVHLIKAAPVGKTVQVASGVLNNLKTKKTTVMIPSNLNSNVKINVQRVTNNVTVTFNNTAQCAQTVKPGSSHDSDSNSVKNIVNIDENGKIITRCGNIGLIKVSPDKQLQITAKSNAKDTVTTNSERLFPIKKRSEQVQVISETSGVMIPQRQVTIISPKQNTNQLAITNGRQLPTNIESTKKTVYRIVQRQPNGQGIIIHRPVQQIQTQPPSTVSNSSSSAVLNPNGQLQVASNIIKPTKVYPQHPNKIMNVRKKPTDGVITYVDLCD